MSVSTIISGPVDKNHVKVDVKYTKNSTPRSFKVPNKNAKAFCEEYKKKEKNFSIMNNMALIGSIIGGVLLSNFLLKNANQVLRYIVGTLSGIGAAAAALIGCSKYADKVNGEFLNKYKSTEIYYDA